MSVVPPRQAAVLSIANADEIRDASKELLVQSVSHLRAFAVENGVDLGHMRAVGDHTLLLRLDELTQEQFLNAIRSMIGSAHDLKVPGTSIALHVRIGAMTERAMRSLVNDVTLDLLAYMNHTDCDAAFLAGDELDVWRRFESTGIVFLSHEQLKYLDPFTGLLNEKRFFSLVADALEQQELSGPKMGVLYLDIDDFKSYNRALGQEQGDELLLFVANTIREAFPTDVVAHISVDRFAVLTDSADIVRKSASIHEKTKTYQRAFAPEIKCGVFFPDASTTSPYVALDCAKLACESIKGRYDMACRFFDEDLRERLFTRRYVARHAEEAVNNQWIRAFAQPVVDTKANTICGFEALARWDDPERGILSPAVFIPTLEDAYLIHKVDAYMVEQVCRTMRERIGLGLPVVPASVNLSRLDFQLCDIVGAVCESCNRWSIPHNMLAIEITESALEGTTNLRQVTDRFRDSGFEVWMDDFGCGYSSLNLLKDYEFDVLKVDMEFLRDMEGNERSKTIVRSVIAMAKSLGIRTLVEGVETKAQRDFLRDAGCDMMQGYLFGKPRPIADNLAWQIS